MRRPHGFGIITDPGGATIEFDTVTCNHCNIIFRVSPKHDPSEAGGFCRCCMEFICGPCADNGTCRPFEKLMEQEEARDRLLRSAGLI